MKKTLLVITCLIALFMSSHILASIREASADPIPWEGIPGGNLYTPDGTQNVGIGTTTPRAKLHLHNGAFLVDGDAGEIEGLDSLPAGSRLMWLPSLGAFRVGRLYTASTWSSANIGEESLGLGPETLASNLGSIAIAYMARSTGTDSVSIGAASQALRDGSVAIGPNCRADGINAVAIGNGAATNASDSIMIGRLFTNAISRSLMIGFDRTRPPAIFADSTGTIFNGTPQQGAPRYAVEVNGNAQINGSLLFDVTESEAGAHKIAVRGSIKAEEIVVATTWADYVFNEDYALPPLGEVAAFIKKNKRLPEIPAGAQIEREGLKMADMMALQMKKIEELTLYAIELKKENEALRAEHQNNRDDINERFRIIEATLAQKLAK